MSTITKERVQEIFLGNGPEPTASEERELARIALASLGAEAAVNTEPVAWVRYCSDGTIDGPLMNYQIEDCRKLTWTPLYAVKPAKTSIHDVLTDMNALDGCREWLLSQEQAVNVGPVDGAHDVLIESAAGYLVRVVEACRAAMLQGAESVSNHDELPEVVLHMGQAMSVFEALKKEVLYEHVRHAELGAMGAVNVQVWTSVLGGTLQYETSNGGCTLRVTHTEPVLDENIQDGWVMVPKELTEVMFNAGKVAAGPTKQPDAVSLVYKAMIDSSPDYMVGREAAYTGYEIQENVKDYVRRKIHTAFDVEKAVLWILKNSKYPEPDLWVFDIKVQFVDGPAILTDKSVTVVHSTLCKCSPPVGNVQFIECTLPAEWEGKVSAINCVFKAAPQKEVK